MFECLAVGLGGFVGAVCRYLIGLISVHETMLFPIKTFVINMIGCIVIGCIVVSVSKHVSWNPQVLLFMKVGVCGGFTTFSTFALETTDLIKGGHLGVAVSYILLSVLVGVGTILIINMFSENI